MRSVILHIYLYYTSSATYLPTLANFLDLAGELLGQLYYVLSYTTKQSSVKRLQDGDIQSGRSIVATQSNKNHGIFFTTTRN